MLTNSSPLSILQSQLYKSSHDLLHLGEDGSPIFALDFSRLNTEVYRLILELYPWRGSSDEEEAGICLVLLMGISATIFTPDKREEMIQSVLNRSFEVLDRLNNSLLKCRLLLYCCAEVLDGTLKEKAKEIIVSWGGRELTEEEEEVMRMYNEVVTHNRI